MQVLPKCNELTRVNLPHARKVVPEVILAVKTLDSSMNTSDANLHECAARAFLLVCTTELSSCQCTTYSALIDTWLSFFTTQHLQSYHRYWLRLTAQRLRDKVNTIAIVHTSSRPLSFPFSPCRDTAALFLSSSSSSAWRLILFWICSWNNHNVRVIPALRDKQKLEVFPVVITILNL